MSHTLPSFNFFNVFLPFFSSAEVSSALDCHKVLYPTHNYFFPSLAAVYSKEQSESMLVFFQSYLLHIVGLQKPGEFHNAVLFCVSCNILSTMTALSFNFKCNLMLDQD